MIARNIARSVFYPWLLLFCFVCWILGSEPGLKTLYGLVKIALPGELQIETLQGRLIDTLELNHIQYTSKQFSFYARKVTLEAQLHALLDNTFKLPSLLLEQARVEFQDSTFNIEKATFGLEARWNDRLLWLECREWEGSYQALPFSGTAQLLFLNNNLIQANAHLMLGEYQFRMQTVEPQKIHWQAQYQSYLASGTGSFSTLQGLRGKGTLAFPKQGIVLPLSKGAPITIKLEQGFITADLNEKGLSFQLLIKENQHNAVEGECFIPGFTPASLWKDAKLSGSFKGKINDFRLVYQLTPAVSHIKASINFQANLKGSLKKPEWDIQLGMSQGQFSLPKQGIILHHLKSDVRGSLPGKLEVISTGRIGDSGFQFKGFIDPLSPEGNTHFNFQGQQLKLYDTATLYLIASPKAVFSYLHKKIHIDGEVVIREANIRLPDETTKVVYSQDVVFVDPSKSTGDTPLFFPRVHFIVQDNTRFKGHGLDAAVNGKLWVERRPDGLYTGLGRLTIKEGKYRLPNAMGYIHHGRLLFPVGTLLYNPLLDIRITQKQVDQLEDGKEVGLYIQGTLQKPSYHLYSNQALQQAEILSRLGFGSEEQENSNYQRQLLSQSAMLFNSTANPLFGQLQTKLGLEEIGIQSRPLHRNTPTSSGNDSLLVLGKSLSKRLYLQFMQGTLDPISILRLKYFITPKTALSLEKSNEGMGLDLSFSIEKD